MFGYVYVCVCGYGCMWVGVYVYVYGCVCVYVCVRVYMYVCMCVYMYMYMYIQYTHTRSSMCFIMARKLWVEMWFFRGLARLVLAGPARARNGAWPSVTARARLESKSSPEAYTTFDLQACTAFSTKVLDVSKLQIINQNGLL